MKRKKCKISILLLGMVLALGVFSTAFASSNFLAPFNTANGTSYNCGVCHTTPTASSSARNQFGLDWANASIGNHSYTIIAALASRDSDGDGYTNIVEIQAKTYPGDATSHPATGGDTTLPVVTGFTIPTTSTTLNVPISLFTATDNVGVTGYLVNESATKPLASATGWSTSTPSSYTFATAGTKTLYAWAKDAAGNVSASLSGAVTVTSGGGTTTIPAITDFQIPFSSTSRTVPILSFTANAAVTGYLVTEMALPVTPPAPNAAGWRTTPPTSYTFSSPGLKALYAWAKDGAGNLAEPWSHMVDVIVNDVTPPTIMDFSIAKTSNSLTVPVLSFKAIDDLGVAGYLITTTPTKPLATAAGWSATPPTSYTFTSGGTQTLYGWTKDGAGNVSALPLSATVNISTGTSTSGHDFNGDNLSDLLWWNKTTGSVGVWYMNGAVLSSTAVTASGVDLNWTLIGTGDFNSDGRPDLLWRNKTTGSVGVWYMNGAVLSSTAVTASGVDLNWTLIGTGDFNSDGKPDLLWWNKTTGSVGVWYMNGAVLSSTAVIASGVDLNWTLIGTGDFNSDGRPDLLWWNKTTGSVGVWYMNGAVLSSTAVIASGVPLDWVPVGTLDLNNDGKPDLLWRNKTTGDVGVWYMNGAVLISTAVIASGVPLDWVLVAQ